MASAPGGPAVSDGDWIVATRRHKGHATARPEHHFSLGEARELEQKLNIRYLARALRSTAADRLMNAGWEYNGVHTEDAVETPLFDTYYEYRYVPIAGNPWRDQVVFRRSRSSDNAYDDDDDVRGLRAVDAAIEAAEAANAETPRQ